jgi:nitroimidazol reductase NimA-like FMN-containing flavoprotein (pyridoxamine 5'-phosphate oxidase superfamily)
MTTLEALSRQRSLDLLASVPYGRVVFSQRALPAIRPVNHLVHDGHVIIRSNLGSALSVETTLSGAVVVAYEVDMIDATTQTGWSVVVTGTARTVLDEAEVSKYERLLHPWIDDGKDTVIRISIDLITGYALVPATAGTRSGDSPPAGFG